MIENRTAKQILFLAGVMAGTVFGQNRPFGASELGIAMKKLNVLGSALYVGAHPDDENSSVIATLARGRLLRTAYLSMTRGEGGQNLVGSEKGDLLGVIRTQELLSARRIDGGEQFFASAVDFGYSKSAEETIRIWGREKIVGDIVWVIRLFRPDVIMTRFSETFGSHGNHLSSAILTREAFDAAGDPSRYPEQLAFVRPWQPKRMVFNVFRFGGSGADPSSQSVKLDVGGYSPVLGESFSEISGRSRSMHKSQGFGAGENRGTSWQYFDPTAGDQAEKDLFDGINTTWSRVQGGERIGEILSAASREFSDERPWESIPQLIKALREMKKLSPDPWVDWKQKELTEVILGCAGVWADALASEYEASPGSRMDMTISVVNRSPVSLSLKEVGISAVGLDSLVNRPLPDNVPVAIKFSVVLPKDIAYSQPYWLQNEHEMGAYAVESRAVMGLAENPPSIEATLSFVVEGESLSVGLPMRYRWIDPVAGEQDRRVMIVPAVTVNLVNPTIVFPDQAPKEIRVNLVNHEKNRSGSVRLDVPAGWKVSPASVPFNLVEKGEEQTATFVVQPVNSANGGTYRAVAESNGVEFSRGITDITYSHISPQIVMPVSKGSLVRVEIRKTGRRVGYVMGPGDEIPEALRQIGYDVKILSDADLEAGDLGVYDAIIAGVRAYNTRPALTTHHQRLMEYVKGGGRYVVQYTTTQRGGLPDLGPFPFNVSRDRVTVEDAPVTFENPLHPVLLRPNRITAKDFGGWVQERGLYFADSWDEHYDAVLGCHDPGEPQRKGGLLYARYGKGAYIFTGYAFFRQLPAGVSGAYRMFVNLISNND